MHTCISHAASNHLLTACICAPAQIAKVIYPGLPSHPAHARAQELFKQGFGGMVCFEVKGGVTAAEAFLRALTLPLSAPR